MGATKRLAIVLATVAGVMGGTSNQASAFSSGGLAVGGRHACAFFSGGYAINGYFPLNGASGAVPRCWGANDFGQGSPPGGIFAFLTAGLNHTCALRNDGTPVCWGDGSHGETTTPAGALQQIAAGDSFTCGIRGDLTLVCWGKNDLGQSTPPAGHYFDVKAGYSTACARRDDGAEVCWGRGNLGAMSPPAGSSDFFSVAVGFGTVCAIPSAGGPLTCWGDPSNGLTSPPSFPAAAGLPEEVEAGNGFFCANASSLEAGAVNVTECWGLANPATAQPPQTVLNPFGFGDAYGCGLEIAAGALGAVYPIACWGSNQDGQSTPPVACPAGQSGAFGVTPCNLCAAGKYSATAGSVGCAACPGGAYSPSSGATQCLTCPAGTFTPFSVDGAAACTPCAPGSYSFNTHAYQCTTCPGGQIAPSPGSLTCTLCAPGLFSDPTHTQCVATQVPAVPQWGLVLLGLLLVSLAWGLRRVG
jgi:hypothetical protein